IDINQVTKQMQMDWVVLTDKAGRPIVPAASGPFTPSSPPLQGPSDPLQTPLTPPQFVQNPDPLSYPPAPSLPGDRPFVHRDPGSGYLDFDLELVLALTDQGFTWGGVEFGRGGPNVGGSGDLMHFELSRLGREILRDAQDSVLPSAIA